jgi:hypothetical protein
VHPSRDRQHQIKKEIKKREKSKQKKKRRGNGGGGALCLFNFLSFFFLGLFFTFGFLASFF